MNFDALPFHVFDIETSGIGRHGSIGSVAEFLEASRPGGDYLSSTFAHTHSRQQILQVFATGLPFYKPRGCWNGFDIEPDLEYAHTYVKPGKGFRTSRGFVPFEFSRFTKRTRTLERAAAQGSVSEEEAARQFYQSLGDQIQTRGAARIGGWNVAFDLAGFETAAYRYDSLKQYRGFFAAAVDSERLQIVSLEEPFLELAWRYGQEHPEFAAKYLRMRPNGAVVRHLEDMRKVPGWSAANLSRAMRLPEHVHEATADVQNESILYRNTRSVLNKVQAGIPIDRASKGLLADSHTTVQAFFEDAYGSRFLAAIEQEADAGAALAARLGEALPTSRKPLWILAGFAASAVAAGLAFGKRRDRQTQITGLDDSGIAAIERHQRTDFGSGWRGQQDSTTLPVAVSLAAAGTGTLIYRSFLQRPEGPLTAYRAAKLVEDRSPNFILRTFGLQNLASSYIPKQLIYQADEIYASGKLTRAGEHLQRVLGRELEQGRDYIFTRDTGRITPYLRLEGDGDLVRFAIKGRATGASARLGRQLGLDTVERIKGSRRGPWKQRALEFLDSVKDTQRFSGYTKGPEQAVDGVTQVFQPLYRKSLRAQSRVVSLDLAERMQKLLGEVGLGLPSGSWNKAFHLPLAGTGGYVNELLAKRVLPVYLGWQALKHIDAQLDHRPRDTVASLPLRAKLVQAELTDRLPGARKAKDWWDDHVPGYSSGVKAVPLAGVFLAGLVHYTRVVRGGIPNELRKAAFRGTMKKWSLPFVIASIPLMPQILGSHYTAQELRDQYSGKTPVPVRTGRWWELGSTPLMGAKIKYFRPHWYARMRSDAYEKSVYGSAEDAAELNPLLHPISYLRDPYQLEERRYHDRPYPMASPAFTDVPFIGPVLAATVGRVVKRPVRMRAKEWSGDDYQIFGPKVEPRGPAALAPEKPQEEFSLGQVARRELEIAEEYTGLPGFIAKSAIGKFQDPTAKRPVYFQGSREMTALARAYYEKELGGVPGLSIEGSQYGFTEPLRRFVQREPSELKANEIPNAFSHVSWLPGADYLVDFKKGDPFNSIPEGYMRLPGEGYESLNPEVAGLAPEDYPDFHRLKILADIAPYSSRFYQYAAIVQRQVANDTEKKIEVEQIIERVEQMKKSSLEVAKRRFSVPTEEIAGTVASATPEGIELAEYPGQRFTFSSAGLSAADLSARILGEQNRLTADQVAQEVDARQARQAELVQQKLKPGTAVKLTLPKGASQHATETAAVVEADGENVNRTLIAEGLALDRLEDAGPEAQAMSGVLGNALGRYAEALSFTGDSSPLNPLRYIPTPYHTKLWQQRTALEQYRNQELYGTRERRWDRPDDFIGPYFRGEAYRLTGKTIAGGIVDEKRDLDTLADQLAYLRGLAGEALHPDQRGRYAAQAARTNTGANLTGASAEQAARTLPRRERYYFERFVKETDPDKRAEILESVPAESARALSAQWVAQDLRIRQARGEEPPEVTSEGRVVSKVALQEYQKSNTALGYGDFLRSKEIAAFFQRRHLNLPQAGDAILSDDIDYEDVKLKIIQNEGWDAHDFDIFTDRTATLWRKPYLDGAVRELTSGRDESGEALRRAVERMMIAARTPGHVRATSTMAPAGASSITVSIDEQPDAQVLQDVRRNPEAYQQ